MIRELVTIILAVAPSYAGVNSAAVIRVDMTPATQQIDSVLLETATGRNFEVAVWADSVTDLGAFSVRMRIDTADFEHLSIATGGNGFDNVLAAAPVAIVKHDTVANTAEIAVTLGSSGSVTTAHALLGMFSFSARLLPGDTARIELLDAVLQSSTGEFETFEAGSNHLVRGLYVVTDEVRAGRHSGPNALMPLRFIERRGCLEVQPPSGWSGGPSELRIVRLTGEFVMSTGIRADSRAMVVPLAGLAPGCYVACFATGDKRWFTQFSVSPTR